MLFVRDAAESGIAQLIIFTYGVFIQEDFDRTKFMKIYESEVPDSTVKALLNKYKNECAVDSLIAMSKTRYGEFTNLKNDIMDYRKFIDKFGKIPTDTEGIISLYKDVKKFYDSNTLKSKYMSTFKKYNLNPYLIFCSYVHVVGCLKRWLEDHNENIPTIDENPILWAVANEWINQYETMRPGRKRIISEFSYVTDILKREVERNNRIKNNNVPTYTGNVKF
jgi:hypothetical protein